MASLNGDAYGESVIREAKGIPDAHKPGHYLLVSLIAFPLLERYLFRSKTTHSIFRHVPEGRCPFRIKKDKEFVSLYQYSFSHAEGGRRKNPPNDMHLLLIAVRSTELHISANPTSPPIRPELERRIRTQPEYKIDV